jgi:hypothetical protein
MPQITGRVFISIGGDRLRSKEGAKAEMGGIKRKAEISDSGVDGHSESIVEPKITFKISHTAKTSLTDIHAYKGTVTFETDTNRVYTLFEGFSVTPPGIEKGESDFEFSGTEMLEG